MKIIDTLWFSGSYGCIGIVVGEDEITGKRKAYIGPSSGGDAKGDTDYIAANGSPFTKAQADLLVELLTKKNGK